MRLSARASLAACALAAALAVGRAFAGGEVIDYPAAGAQSVTLGVPRFAAEPVALGLNVSTILGLQIFTTFRKAIEGRVFFGDALLLWSPEALSADVATHELAETWGRERNCRLVLWGAVVPYASHVVVQAQLTVLPSSVEKQPETPVVNVPGAGPIRLSLPSARYTFTPLVLKKQVVDAYTRPEALVLYSEPHGRGQRRGSVGPRFKALQATAQTVQVTGSAGAGWLNLPELAENHSEISDFISGVIRVFRADYDGARQYLHRVLRNPEAGITVKSDAYLYLAIADYQMRDSRSAAANVERARSLDPYGASAARAAVFLALPSAFRDGNPAQLRQRVEVARALVPDTDPVMRAAEALLR